MLCSAPLRFITRYATAINNPAITKKIPKPGDFCFCVGLGIGVLCIEEGVSEVAMVGVGIGLLFSSSEVEVAGDVIHQSLHLFIQRTKKRFPLFLFPDPLVQVREGLIFLQFTLYRLH